MDTDRFETFYDAILAIVITILVLKIPQPLTPEWGAFFSNFLNIVTYLIVFLSIINIWYSNQRLFQHIKYINNKALVSYGFSIFLFSLFPYFASWLSLNVYSLTAEVIFGLLMVFANISHIISVVVVFGANKSNEKLQELNIKKIHFIIPLIVLLFGFIITFTVFTPGIYLTSLVAVILSIFYNRRRNEGIGDTGRFEALIDAIIAIIITIIVLEIPTAVNGDLASLLELKLEFIAYAVSFIICFNVWNFTYNLFSIVNKINYKCIWAISMGLFFFQNYNTVILNILFTVIFIILGYFYYPPLISISCIFSIIVTWIFMIKKINILRLI